MTTYEIRNGQFTVNGEEIPVSPLIIKPVLISHQYETGHEISTKQAWISVELGRRILRLERDRSIAAMTEGFGGGVKGGTRRKGGKGAAGGGDAPARL